MKNKSLGVNTILYTMKIVSSMIFPLITFPYISRVLLASGVGEYNFSQSFVSYFSLIASLGISTYAIREGAKIRDDASKFQVFAKEIFSLNLSSTVVSMVLLVAIVIIFPVLKQYQNIILILGLSIPLTLLGTEWIFNVYEDFFYITVRSICFQLVSMILMFSFVKSKEDVWKYAIISVIATAGSNILNFKKVKKYFKHGIISYSDFKKHIVPVLILFASAVASQIYVNSDITMLGIIKGDYDTGIYSAASKIYNIIRSLLTAVITIVLPRLSYLNTKKNRAEYVTFLSKLFNAYACIILPAAVGLMFIAEDALLLLSGKEFVIAAKSLRILCIAMIFSMLGSFIANTVLVIHSKEKIIFKATCVGAIVNIVANFFFISKYSYNGAALATLLSEMIVFAIQLIGALRCTQIRNVANNMCKAFAGLLGMSAVYMLVRNLEIDLILRIIVIVASCGVTYMSIMLLLKQEILYGYYEKIRKAKF